MAADQDFAAFVAARGSSLFQWESESTVLLTWAVTVGPQGAVSPDAFGIHRCWVTRGECQPLPGSISLPSSMGAHPGG